MSPRLQIPTNNTDIQETETGRAWERALLAAVAAIRFGSVEVVVHDGRIVQIEKREKLRMPDPRRPGHRRPDDTPPGRVDRKAGGTALTSDEECDP